MLKTHKLVKKFGGLTAVKEVSLDVKAGEIVALIGPNGAGKTTFFNCLNQVTVPTSGTVTFAGQSLVSVVTPVTRQWIMHLSRVFAALSLLWLPLVLGVVWPDTFFRLEAVLALVSLMLFRVYLVRPLNNFRPWSRLLLILFTLVDAACAVVWICRSDTFSEVSFFGLFPLYPLLIPGAILLFIGSLVLLFMFNLTRIKEAFGQHLHADVITR
ncbi:MAG: ATP-binding cassette domain-containing protein, partial [Deltaproteobacteria bacterium]|nr:ATP-binding cassette domain-containing protein [Candidatus Tharpella sp.]